MSNSSMAIILLLIIIIIVFIVLFSLTITSDNGGSSAGKTCSTTPDCGFGFACLNGHCSNLPYSHCDPNNDHCPEGFICFQSVCIPRDLTTDGTMN